MRTFEKEDSITIEGTLVGTPTLPREIRAPHPRWVEEAGWWEETAGHSFNTGNSFFQEEFFSKNLVGTPTLSREIRAPHPRWVEEAGWWEETAGHSFNTGNSFFQEEIFSKTLVGTPTKPSPKERNRL